MFEPHPWFIGLEGVEHSAEVARMLAWSATNGASGVITPGDLRVRAQSVPTDSVRIAPGGFVVESKFAGASQQSYVERAPTQTSLEVPATGSSGGATRYVVARINDPDYPGGGTVPSAPNDATYSAPYLVSSLSSSRTEVPLAKIVQPANTAAITNAMITDLREVANPRELPFMRPRANVASDKEYNNITGADGEWFPNNGGEQTFSIPSWATRVQIVADWSGIRYESGKNIYGECWVEFGPYLRPSTRQYSTQRFMYDSAGATANTYRTNWKAFGDLYIPAALRGTDQVFVMKARKTGPDTGASVDGMSGVCLAVRFLEVADPSDS